MGHTLRLAEVGDAAGCAAIYDPICLHTAISFELEPPGEAQMARRIEAVTRHLPWLICEDEGEVLGYAYAHPYRERPAYRWAVESSVYVAESARGKGIGRALYASLFALLRAQNYHVVVAGVALPNPGSVRLHASVGFQQVGIYPAIGFKHGAWRDVSRWHLALTEPPEEPREPLSIRDLLGTPSWDMAIAAGTALLAVRG